MSEENSKCFFSCEKSGPLITGGEARIRKIIESSIQRQDSYHEDLQSKLEREPNISLSFHKTCISTYTSKLHIERHLKRTGSTRQLESEPPLRRRRSQHPTFNFTENCLICGDMCLPKDPRHPNRWRMVNQCKTVEAKEHILQICDKRGDDIASQVRVRVLGALSDLHAAYAQYHRDCYKSFSADRNICAASRYLPETDIDITFSRAVSAIEQDPKRFWNSVEIYELCMQRDPSASATISEVQEVPVDDKQDDQTSRSSRALLINKLERHFGDDILVMRIDGCASLLCLRKFVPDTLKLIKANDTIGPVAEVI